MSESELTRTERRLSSLLMASGQPQEGSLKNPDGIDLRDVFSDGAPPIEQPKRSFASPFELRRAIRAGDFNTPTNGICPGYMQANLIVLGERYAFDFLMFCQKNKQACPLVEVLDVGSVEAQCGRGSDLRVDVPNFSYDGALLAADIPLRSVEQNKNVPMYKTNVATKPAGIFHGNVVVSMKPIKAMDVAKEVLITSQYPQAHGPPLCVGCPQSIGISDISKPDWGDAVEILEDEVPVFHYCGVTPQQVLLESGVNFFVSHSPGHMFVTDLPSDTVV